MLRIKDRGELYTVGFGVRSDSIFKEDMHWNSVAISLLETGKKQSIVKNSEESDQYK